MGKARSRDDGRSKTLPSSPSSHHSSSSSSSSSSDFEFTISLSPHKSSFNNNLFCPADELFFKGQILPLHLTPRLSMVQTLSLSSSSNSTSATSSTTASRDSTASNNSSDFFLLSDSCDSSRRPSSVTEEEEHDLKSIKRFSNYQLLNHTHSQKINNTQHIKKPNKYFSLARFSNVFRKETKNGGNLQGSSENNSVKRMSKSAKEMMRKYMKKVKPFYEKLSSNTKHQESSRILNSRKELNRGLSQSFSDNVRYPRRKSNCVSSCPSSMRSSPNRVIGNGGEKSSTSTSLYSSSSSSMEELQNAIQGAIAHCKNSMTQNKKFGMMITTSKEI